MPSTLRPGSAAGALLTSVFAPGNLIGGQIAVLASERDDSIVINLLQEQNPQHTLASALNPVTVDACAGSWPW